MDKNRTRTNFEPAQLTENYYTDDICQLSPRLGVLPSGDLRPYRAP
jgi:hypothetical protein